MANLGLNGDVLDMDPDNDSPASTPFPNPTGGPSVTSSQSFVTINGSSSILTTTATVETHSDPLGFTTLPGTITHAGATMSPPAYYTGQTFVTINGNPIVLDGAAASCSEDVPGYKHELVATGPAFVDIQP